jgi:hypothetical protein
MAKSTSGSKGLFHLIPSGYSQSPKEAQAKSQAGKGPGGRNQSKHHGGRMFTNLLHMTYSTCFLGFLVFLFVLFFNSGQSAQRWPYPVNWVLPHQSLSYNNNNNCPINLTAGQPEKAFFSLSIEVSSSQITLAYDKLTPPQKNLNQHKNLC